MVKFPKPYIEYYAVLLYYPRFHTLSGISLSGEGLRTLPREFVVFIRVCKMLRGCSQVVFTYPRQ